MASKTSPATSNQPVFNPKDLNFFGFNDEKAYGALRVALVTGVVFLALGATISGVVLLARINFAKAVAAEIGWKVVLTAVGAIGTVCMFVRVLRVKSRQLQKAQQDAQKVQQNAQKALQDAQKAQEDAERKHKEAFTTMANTYIAETDKLKGQHKNENETFVTEANALRKTIVDQSKTKTELENQLYVQSQTLNRLTIDLTSANQNIDKLANIKQENDDIRKQKTELQERIKALATENSTLANRNQELVVGNAKELGDLDEKIKQLKKQLRKKSNELSEITAQLERSASHKGKPAEDTNDRIDQMQKEIQSFQEQIAEKQAEIDGLNSKLSLVISDNNQVKEGLEQQIVQLQAQSDQLEIQLEDQSNQLKTESTDYIVGLRELQDKITVLTGKVSEEQQKSLIIAEEFDGQSKKLEALTAENDKLKKMIGDQDARARRQASPSPAAASPVHGKSSVYSSSFSYATPEMLDSNGLKPENDDDDKQSNEGDKSELTVDVPESDSDSIGSPKPQSPYTTFNPILRVESEQVDPIVDQQQPLDLPSIPLPAPAAGNRNTNMLSAGIWNSHMKPASVQSSV